MRDKSSSQLHMFIAIPVIRITIACCYFIVGNGVQSISINDNRWRLFWRVYRKTIQSNDGNMWIFCWHGNKGYIFIHESLARNRKQTLIN